MRRPLFKLATFAAACLLASAAAAVYPERPIRLMVPSSAGSGPDAVARLLAARMGEMLGQQIVADNRAGANGVLASETVARATPDGYTLLMTSGGHTINPHIYRKLPYDALADFTPITLFVTSGGLVIVVTPSFGARSIAQLIDLARAAPGKITYASAGVGNLTHLAGEMFCQAAGVKLTHVPYKGGGPAIIDVIGGQVPLMFASGAVSIPYVKAGRLRALAYTGLRRTDQLPDVPTLDESGLKGFEASGWYGLYGPARLPAPLAQRIYEVARDSVRHPETRAALAHLGIDPADVPPAAFARFLKEDLVKYGRIVKAAGVEPQ